MPANLTPQYLEADRRFRQAKTPAERTAALEDMLALVPKHEGTEKMQADRKQRFSGGRIGLTRAPGRDYSACRERSKRGIS